MRVPGHGHLNTASNSLGVVSLTDEVTVDEAVPVAWHEPVVTDDARETRHVIDVRLRAHYKLAGGNRLGTGGARTRTAEHSANNETSFHCMFAFCRPWLSLAVTLCSFLTKGCQYSNTCSWHALNSGVVYLTKPRHQTV